MFFNLLLIFSLLIITFINKFKIFTNLYRNLINYYITPYNFPVKNRLRPGYIIFFIFKPYNLNFIKIIKRLKILKDLNINVKINILKKEKLVYI